MDPYEIENDDKIENDGITCNRVVFIRTLIPSKKQGIEVLYLTYYIIWMWIQYTIDCINPFSTFSLFILHLN